MPRDVALLRIVAEGLGRTQEYVRQSERWPLIQASLAKHMQQPEESAHRDVLNNHFSQVQRELMPAQAAADLIEKMAAVYDRDFTNVPGARMFKVSTTVEVKVSANSRQFETLKDRHVLSSAVDMTRSKWILDSCTTTVGIMAGSSGSGKTVDCLLVAGKDGLCVRLTPSGNTWECPHKEVLSTFKCYDGRRQ